MVRGGPAAGEELDIASGLRRDQAELLVEHVHGNQARATAGHEKAVRLQQAQSQRLQASVAAQASSIAPRERANLGGSRTTIPKRSPRAARPSRAAKTSAPKRTPLQSVQVGIGTSQRQSGLPTGRSPAPPRPPPGPHAGRSLPCNRTRRAGADRPPARPPDADCRVGRDRNRSCCPSVQVHQETPLLPRPREPHFPASCPRGARRATPILRACRRRALPFVSRCPQEQAVPEGVRRSVRVAGPGRGR